MKERDRAVALVTFGHEPFAARVPMRICSENRYLCANVMRGMKPALAKHMRGHPRRGRLAVQASDDYPALRPHDRSERFGATHRRFPRIARAEENRIVDLDRGRKNNELGVARVLGAMLLMKIQARALQSLRFERAQLIRAADLVSELEQKRGDSTHPAAGNTDEMDLVSLA